MQVAHLGLCFIVSAFLVCECAATNAPLTIGPSVKYSHSGTSIFDTSSYYLSGPSTVSGLLYSIPLIYAMNDTTYKSTISLQEINSQLSNGEFSLYFELDSKQESALDFLIYSYTMNKIQAITFRYLVIASVWGTFSGYWHVYTVFPGQVITSTSPLVDTITDLSPVNFASNIKVFAVLTGFDIVASTSTNQLSLLIDLDRTSSTSALLTISTYSSQAITLYGVSYSQLAIDLNEINVIPGRVHVGTFSGSSGGPVSYTDPSNIAMSYNTMVGLRGFHIKDDSMLQWRITINPGVSIGATSNNSFIFFSFIYLILEQSWCPLHMPYLLQATLTCYDICPQRYYSRQISWTCQPCLYDCYLCTGPTNCTQCNQTLDFRRMNSTNARCKPIQGYYDDGGNHPTALECIDPCLRCQSALVCYSCNVSYYLSGAVCLPCSDNCFNCTSNTSCIECFLPYEEQAGSCILNCSHLVTNCMSCQVISNTTNVNCTQCQIGLFLNTPTNNCSIICGDGLVASSENCDDGNLINGDGCNQTCTIEPAFYCQGIIGNMSNCFACSSNCLNCTSSINCSLCQALYIFNGSDCTANCSQVQYCLSCKVVSQTSTGNYVQCEACSGSYSVDSSSNQCKPICGDGLLTPEELCDDGNLIVGDGCSGQCQVQTYFFCNRSNTNNQSECFLTTLQLKFIDVIKENGQNSGTMRFKPNPAGLPLFQTLNWAEILIIEPDKIDIIEVRYDPSSGEVTAHFNYNTHIDGQPFMILVNTSKDSTLSKVTSNSSLIIKMTSSNNQAFLYYFDGNYQLANIVKYLALACSACAIIFLLIGIFAGRLIGLQCAALIQLTFISLLSLQNISPSFAALSLLSYSLGYNKIRAYDTSQDIDRTLKGMEISQLFVYNYNLVGAFVIASLIIALVFRIAAMVSGQQNKNKWLRRAKLAVAEYTLYFFVFFGYLAYLSVIVSFKYSNASQDILSLMCIVVGAVIIVTGVIFTLVYWFGETYFTEFKDKFRTGFGKKYYIFPIIQRIISPAILATFLARYTANVIIIVILLLLCGAIFKGQPYEGHRKNYRPFTNYLLAIAIQLIFLIVGLNSDPVSTFAIYGPLVVVFLLLICVIYSGYALVKQLREYWEASCKQSQLSIKENEDAKMREFAETLIRDSNISIIRKSSYCNQGEENGKECISPLRVHVLNMRDRLVSIKMTNLPDRQQFLDRSANQENIMEILSEMSESI